MSWSIIDCLMSDYMCIWFNLIPDSLVVNNNVMGFNKREAKLAERVREMEEQNQLLRHQLR